MIPAQSSWWSMSERHRRTRTPTISDLCQGCPPAAASLRRALPSVGLDLGFRVGTPTGTQKSSE